MIRLIANIYARPEDRTEKAVTADTACRILHSAGMPFGIVLFDTEEEESQIEDAYYRMYAKDFGVIRTVGRGDPLLDGIARTAETDIFCVENMSCIFQGGVRKLGPETAGGYTHAAVFHFDDTRLLKTLTIENEKDPEIQDTLRSTHNIYIRRDLQVKCFSREEAKAELDRIWSKYEPFFRKEIMSVEDLGTLITLNGTLAKKYMWQ